MQRTLHSIVALLLTFAVGSKAQTLLWELEPTDAFKRLTPFVNGLFQATGPDGKMGFVNAQGQVIVPLANDEMTGFYDDKALLLCREGDRERISGYLTRDGRYTPFTSPFYVLEGQAFFSEGMLTVENEKGQKGYIDQQGHKVFGFTKKHLFIKPFHEGYAVVCTDIYRGVPLFFPYDKKGLPLDITPNPNEQGDFTMTNFDQGLSYVLFANSNSKVYTYSLQGEWKLFSTNGFDDPDDYLYRYGKNEDIHYQALSQPMPDAAVELTVQDQKYGFRQNGQQLLPCQLSAATPFVDHLSVVQLQGKTGILRFVPDATSFALATPRQPIDYYAGQQVACAFTLSAPSEWQDKPLSLTLTDGEQTVYSGQGAGNHTFNLTPRDTAKTFNASVSAGGLLLWEGPATYTFHKLFHQLDVAVSIPNDNQREGYFVALDNQNNIPVNIVVTNPNDEAVTATIVVTGSATLVASQPTTVTIEPQKSATIRVHFHVVKRQYVDQSVSVSVTTSSGADGHGALGPIELRSNF